MERIRVSGITTSMNLSKIVLEGVEDAPGRAAEIFGLLGEKGINVELISQSPSGGAQANISFVVLEREAERVIDLLKKPGSPLKVKSISHDPKSAVITVYSDAMAKTPGVASQIFKALCDVGVNIDIISTTLNGVSVVVARDRCSEALHALNKTFEVEGVGEHEGEGPPGKPTGD